MSSILAAARRVDSHTSTPEWQVFEKRMRDRHLERCLLQASAALDAGALDAARAALYEARGVCAGAPDVAALTQTVSEVPVTPSLRRCLTPSAAAIAALLGFGLGWGIGGTATVNSAALFTLLVNVVKIATSAGVPQSV